MLRQIVLLALESLLFALPIVLGYPLLRTLFGMRERGRLRWLRALLLTWLVLFCVDAIGTYRSASSFIGLFVFAKYYWGVLVLLLMARFVMRGVWPLLWSRDSAWRVGVRGD